MKRKLPLVFLLLVFLGITGYAGFQLLLEQKEYQAGKDTYDALSQYVHTSPPPAPTQVSTEPVSQTVPQATLAAEQPVTEPVPTEPDPWPTVDFDGLKAVNPDVTAWIWQEGTAINYPVVQGIDNSQYLYRLVDGTTNPSGSIFMDFRNQRDLSDRHTVLYGHHMKNGAMFASITNYRDQAYYEEHPHCLLLTPEANYRLEFFAGFVANLNSDTWKLAFSSDAEFSAWLERAKDRSTFESSLTPTPQDRVVTLSTCTYDYDDARFVLLGVLKQQE